MVVVKYIVNKTMALSKRGIFLGIPVFLDSSYPSLGKWLAEG